MVPSFSLYNQYMNKVQCFSLNHIICITEVGQRCRISFFSTSLIQCLLLKTSVVKLDIKFLPLPRSQSQYKF